MICICPALGTRAGKDLGLLLAPFDVFMETSLLDTPSHQCLVSENGSLIQATPSYFSCVVLLFKVNYRFSGEVIVLV